MYRELLHHTMILEQLAVALRQVELSRKLVADQRARVEQARSLGLDVTEHATTLALFEDIAGLYVAHRDQLRVQLGAVDRPRERSAGFVL